MGTAAATAAAALQSALDDVTTGVAGARKKKKKLNLFVINWEIVKCVKQARRTFRAVKIKGASANSHFETVSLATVGHVTVNLAQGFKSGDVSSSYLQQSLRRCSSQEVAG